MGLEEKIECPLLMKEEVMIVHLMYNNKYKLKCLETSRKPFYQFACGFVWQILNQLLCEKILKKHGSYYRKSWLSIDRSDDSN